MLGYILLLALWLPSIQGAAPVTPESAWNDAGYINVHNDEHHLFYWVFESRNNPSTDPVILWLSGGPGCSSSLALFGENGPLQIENDLSLTVNEFSWNSNATVVWVDQPVGTGYSYGGLLHNEDQIGSDMLEFIIGFFNKYSQFQGLDFYIYGESYAGHYVPVVSKAVLSYQLNESSTSTKLYLKGSAIGNGLTDPYEQYKWYLPYSIEHGLVGNTSLNIMSGLLNICEPLIHSCNNISNLNDDINDDKMIKYDQWEECLSAVIVCNLGEITPVSRTGVNPYDVRIPCGDSKICYDFSNIDAYMNDPNNMEIFGVPPNRKWKECKSTVEEVLVGSGDWMKEYENNVVYLLENNINVLIYAGEYDFICNWMGNIAWTKTLNWSGSTAFNNAMNTTWMATDDNIEGAGSYIHANGFTFLKVKNAGHMVPKDQPYNSLQMLLGHINGFWGN
mmetsp:Transcript_26127/g.30944  ORF Transcript_26127/g.30944 Transcript_26127/m.30944 type:complete len:448 (-) Transcript_26127:90-1433(-)